MLLRARAQGSGWVRVRLFTLACCASHHSALGNTLLTTHNPHATHTPTHTHIPPHLCKLLALLGADCAAVRQVGLVADEHDGHVWVCVLPRILQPGGQVLKGLPPGDVVDQQGASRAAIVAAGDGAEGLLPRLQAAAAAAAGAEGG